MSHVVPNRCNEERILFQFRQEDFGTHEAHDAGHAVKDVNGVREVMVWIRQVLSLENLHKFLECRLLWGRSEAFAFVEAGYGEQGEGQVLGLRHAQAVDTPGRVDILGHSYVVLELQVRQLRFLAACGRPQTGAVGLRFLHHVLAPHHAENSEVLIPHVLYVPDPVTSMQVSYDRQLAHDSLQLHHLTEAVLVGIFIVCPNLLAESEDRGGDLAHNREHAFERVYSELDDYARNGSAADYHEEHNRHGARQ
mmetsp:Transcript_3302/g.9548  ORF Transcript_3302/g.9548 Transcript_3302/m.9548 type:complete len:251 (-) Transcript_3302:1129-1881(-)